MNSDTLQAHPRYIYAGPSWAVSSWPITPDRTNLAKEWGISYLNAAAATPEWSVTFDKIVRVSADYNLPIIWIYNEPLANLEKIANINLTTFVQSDNWKEIWRQCNKACLQQIDGLGVPVLLIGGHSDIVDCDFKNITVGHPSWQKYAAEQSGMCVTNGVIDVIPSDGGAFKLDHCWGAEVIHRFLHENQDIKPHPELLNSVWDCYYFWEELQRRDWFYEVHPNRQSNVEFAKFLKPTVDKFLEKNQIDKSMS